jgi:DNA-binding protein H-NS
MDLDRLTLEELRDLQARVDDAIRDFEGRRRNAAIAELRKVARRYGFTLQALTGARIRTKTKGA